MTRLLVLALALVSTIAIQAQPASVVGAWTVNSLVSGNESTQTCTFTQKDADLSGTCKGERGSFQITGKVDGKTVTWQFDMDYEGQKLTPAYTGTLESADKMAGTVTIGGMGLGGEFTATRAK